MTIKFFTTEIQTLHNFTDLLFQFYVVLIECVLYFPLHIDILSLFFLFINHYILMLSLFKQLHSLSCYSYFIGSCISSPALFLLGLSMVDAICFSTSFVLLSLLQKWGLLLWRFLSLFADMKTVMVQEQHENWCTKTSVSDWYCSMTY